MSRLNLLSRIPFNAWLLLIGVPVAIFWTRFFPTSQMRNLSAATRHVEVLNVLFQKDPRFLCLKARPWTGDGGIIWIHWEDDKFTLADPLRDEDVPDVLKIVRSTHPPVIVRYRDHWITPDEP
ncbi:MAG: hypothetical protein KDL09_17145 [Prosthecobacter sp.]|nr:hypothetical protein [Prosthecobacter sp.]